MEFIFVFFVWFVSSYIFGTICSCIQERRGRDGTRFFWLGFFLGIPGLIIAWLTDN